VLQECVSHREANPLTAARDDSYLP
jgi:hypothetical protein